MRSKNGTGFCKGVREGKSCHVPPYTPLSLYSSSLSALYFSPSFPLARFFIFSHSSSTNSSLPSRIPLHRSSLLKFYKCGRNEINAHTSLFSPAISLLLCVIPFFLTSLLSRLHSFVFQVKAETRIAYTTLIPHPVFLSCNSLLLLTPSSLIVFLLVFQV